MGLFRLVPKIVRKILRKVPTCSAVIVAAGSSERMGGEDKLFIEIDGVPVLAHTLRVFQNSRRIYEIILVAREDSLEKVLSLCENYKISKVSKIIVGGSTRTESVLHGVTAVSKTASLVAIHDAARPCVDNSLIKATIAKAEKHKAAAPGVPVTSTIKRVKNGVIVETVDRDELVEIQTPQVFDVALIKGALTKAIKNNIAITDDCMAVELFGATVHVTEGSVNNIKLTNKEDIPIIEAILKNAL